MEFSQFKSRRFVGRSALSFLLADERVFKERESIAAEEDDINLCEKLWNSTNQWSDKALQTKFIQGLKDGTLDPTDFGGYMVQDSIYCFRAKEAFDIAAKVAQGSLKAFLIQQSKDYEDYYKGLYKNWRIKDATGIELNSACQRYIDALMEVATKPIHLIAACIPCARLWPWLGQQIGVDPSDDKNKFGCYTSFLNDNFAPNPPHDPVYKLLERRVNEAYRNNEVTEAEMLQVYTTSMQCEAAFFGSAVE